MRGAITAYHLYHALWVALDLLLPPTCGGCGRPGSRWCFDCQANVVSPQEPLCETCGTPVTGSYRLCSDCRRAPPRFEALRSWSTFDGPVRKALHGLKYRRDLGLGEALSPHLAEFVTKLHQPVDRLVPVPLGRSRQRERGYNQVGLIARPLSMVLGIDYAPNLLHRTRETRSQVGLTRGERQENVHGAFRASPRLVEGLRILLLDDVATTGSTLSSCAEALHAAGARDVFAVTVARAFFRHTSKFA